MIDGVSFVVPVHNGVSFLRETIEAIALQSVDCSTEIIVIDDGSGDGSSGLIRDLAAIWPLRVIAGEGRGAAAAVNLGVRAARFRIVCQIDQDVVVDAGWLEHVAAIFDDPDVGAVQGYYVTDRAQTLCARAMGIDLEQRYAAIVGDATDHVCTGNTAYRVEALRRIGLFDEALGYGYDNDVSYRLTAAGYTLKLCREARSLHRWRDGLAGYISQQYGFGYGRLDVVAKHPRRFAGDLVSPGTMMAHPVVLLAGMMGLMAAPVVARVSRDARLLVVGSIALIVGLMLERLVAGAVAAWRFKDPTPLAFPVIHVARDLAWVAAILVWCSRRLTGRRSLPTDSMPGRTGSGGFSGWHGFLDKPLQTVEFPKDSAYSRSKNAPDTCL